MLRDKMNSAKLLHTTLKRSHSQTENIMLTQTLDELNNWLRDYWKTFSCLIGFCFGVEIYFVLGIAYHLVTGY